MTILLSSAWKPSMACLLPQYVDTIIIGNGPSALILSYILHGHSPYYIGGHHDSILDQKLSRNASGSLLHLTPDFYAHFLSSLRYSTQALPVNTLLDTLIRPNADTKINPTSCVEWRYEPDKAVSHLAIGETVQPGGQWAEDTVSASQDIGTLSYAEQLSLPGYSFAEHLAKKEKADQCDFVRPTRTEVAEYLSAYPRAVGIADAVRTATRADDVYRTADGGFFIGSLRIKCKHLVLASGIFTVNIPPPPLLAPVAQLDNRDKPLLVIGSGFSAADVIISTPPDRKVIHIYHWAPETRPSPLRGCHHTAYPEYATIYRQMKLAAIASHKTLSARSPLLRRKSNPFFTQRDWTSFYEGLPNAEVLDVYIPDNKDAVTVTIRLSSGETASYEVGGLAYVVGRRGTLDFLSPALRAEVLGITPTTNTSPSLISGRTLRPKAETSLEVAKNVFIIGSLAGDSLIRHAIGGCVFAAGRILHTIPSSYSPFSSPASTPRSTSPSRAGSGGSEETTPDGSEREGVVAMANGHEDLHVDRRKMVMAVEVVSAENMFWERSGWGAGGFGWSRVE
ncbi:hypothetical protein CC80DRAFT_483413 [Byssothecium circinans]|uniref:FAD/NAD(P)-binding domain-containing protein n=1 Tax=Byssothecium circinans TaxID=147558 RepID=A0A6A5TBS7_9PLEO|nr:hypothetical protein CC80DRAFT_483413 [Byssothecium circinans]